MRSRSGARRSSRASRPDAARRLALVLALAGILLTGLGLALSPAKVGEAGVVARLGPALARYDAGNGTTVAAFHCGHWPCGPAYLLPGDATAEVAKRRVYLHADASDWRVVPVDPLSSPHVASPIAEAYAGPFALASPGPRLLPLVVGPVVFAAGVGFALVRLGRLAPAWTTVGGAAGVALGVLGASAGEGGILVALLATALGLGSLALLVSARTRTVGVAVALACATAVLLATQARAWFPAPPAL